jgi:hypothetical protein
MKWFVSQEVEMMALFLIASKGLIYLFFSYQTLFGKIFWSIVLIAMTILGLYWCIAVNP